jgi:hypothetical protein
MDMAKISIGQMKQLVDEHELAHVTLERYGLQYRLGRGMDRKLCCPWHGGDGCSAHTDDNQDFTWCFLCGKDAPHGDRYNVVAGMYNLSRTDAIAKVAFDAGLITKEEMAAKLGGKVSAKEIAELSAMDKARRPRVEIPEETDEHRAFTSFVYEEMHKFFGLSEKHRKMLEETRHLTPERIDRDYFTIPESGREKALFVLHMEREYPDKKEELKTVAGFCVDKRVNRTVLVANDGVGIMIRNSKQEAVSIQVRKDVLKGEGDSRYVWMSSGFALTSANYEGGSSPFDKMDVNYPQKDVPEKREWLAVTEGRFKAEILAQQGIATISVQGVGNYRGILGTIRAMKQQTGISYKNLFVVYDADMLGNVHVLKHALGLFEELKKANGASVQIITWDARNGKGIDDLYFSGAPMKFFFLDPVSTLDCFNQNGDLLLAEWGISKEDLKQEWSRIKKPFQHELQDRMELALGIRSLTEEEMVQA